MKFRIIVLSSRFFVNFSFLSLKTVYEIIDFKTMREHRNIWENISKETQIDTFLFNRKNIMS